MEGGLPNKKIAVVIQARMKSTRLPGKILLPIPLGNGKPLLSWIVDEVKSSKYKPDIIIATSLNPENDVLGVFSEQQNVKCFRGAEEDVLSRFIAIAKNDNYDCIIRLTADNPIVDFKILDNTIAHHFNEVHDYTVTSGLPTGMNFEVIATSALLDLEHHDLTSAEREHVTLFVKNSGRYQTGTYSPAINPLLKNLRLTVDYPSDYALLSNILAYNISSVNLKGIKLVEQLYNQYPWLFETNTANIQKIQFNDVATEVKAAIDFLNKYDFGHAAQLLNNLDKRN